jgi:hypothetical protein
MYYLSTCACGMTQSPIKHVAEALALSISISVDTKCHIVKGSDAPAFKCQVFMVSVNNYKISKQHFARCSNLSKQIRHFYTIQQH